MAAKKWTRNVTFRRVGGVPEEDPGGWILVVSKPEGGNPPGRSDGSDDITVKASEDLPATIEYKLTGFPHAKFVGPDPDENGHASMVWASGSSTLPYTVSADGRTITITDNVSSGATTYSYQIGAYGGAHRWRESHDPQIHNVED